MKMVDKKKIKVLNGTKYLEIFYFIENYKGLSIDCELELSTKFPDIDEKTLSSILKTQLNYKMRANYYKYQQQAGQFLKDFDIEAKKNPNNPNIIVNMSMNIDLSPTVLSRIIVFEKYKNITKYKITELLKNYHLITDPCLSLNVQTSICSDNQEGPIVDIIRRCLGEEYELKLKQMADDAGMVYEDETVLRRTGFDKTPDLKLAIPCLYKGLLVNWIESKALFGDIRTHKRYINQQLDSYCNRFGSGVVIYWLGYLEDILYLKENDKNIIILDNFPSREHLEFLGIDEK